MIRNTILVTMALGINALSLRAAEEPATQDPVADQTVQEVVDEENCNLNGCIFMTREQVIESGHTPLESPDAYYVPENWGQIAGESIVDEVVQEFDARQEGRHERQMERDRREAERIALGFEHRENCPTKAEEDAAEFAMMDAKLQHTLEMPSEVAEAIEAERPTLEAEAKDPEKL